MLKRLLVMVLAGCGRLSFDGVVGAPDDAAMPAFDAADIDALPGDNGDPDGDGVFADDNCPDVANPPRATLGHAQPIQRDHDGDGVGDECDLCPHIAATADADSDLDGIGDACDPQPEIPNPPAFFDGFYDPPDARWRVPDNAGSLADWQVELRDGDTRIGWRQTASALTQRHHLLLSGIKGDVYVDSTFLIDEASWNDPDGASGNRSVAVSYGFRRDADGTADLSFMCGMLRQANSAIVMTAVMRDDAIRNESSEFWLESPLREIRVVGRATRSGGTEPSMGVWDMACTAYVRDPDASLAVVGHMIDVAPDGELGLRTFGMTAWFDYLFYVELVASP